EQLDASLTVRPLSPAAIDSPVMLPLAHRGARGLGAPRRACPVAQHGQVAPAVADITDQQHDVGALALEQREGGARRARKCAVQMHVRDAGETQAGETRVEPRDREIVPGELDRRRLAHETVAQRGGGESTSRGPEKTPARERGSHVIKVEGDGTPPPDVAAAPLHRDLAGSGTFFAALHRAPL